MNWLDGLQFVTKITVMDSSLDQTLTKENGHAIWNKGHTNWHGCHGIGHVCQNLGGKGLLWANLIRNDVIGINDIHRSKICGVSVDERWFAVGIINIANKALSAAKALGTIVGMKRYWISPALVMPMIAVSVGELAKSLRSKSDFVHL